MKTLALCAATVLCASAASAAVDLNLNLWLDGRWICGGVVTVGTGDETDFCEARHDGKTIRLHGTLSERSGDQYEIAARVIEIAGDEEKDRHKFVAITPNEEAAEVSQLADGREKFRFKGEIVH